MECRCGLNQPLQKRPLRLGLAQPNFLPHFVRLEEFFGVEELYAAFEFTVVGHLISCAKGDFDKLLFARSRSLRGTRSYQFSTGDT